MVANVFKCMVAPAPVLIRFAPAFEDPLNSLNHIDWKACYPTVDIYGICTTMINRGNNEIFSRTYASNLLP